MTDSIKVEQTTDYDKFKTIDANRKVSDKMAKHYAQSLVDNGNWLKISPVVVNEGFFVIDGQHRVEAARMAGLPVYYTIANGLTINDTIIMNNDQKRWLLEDYIEAYAKLGNKHYKNLIDIHEDMPSLSYSALVLLAYGREKNGYLKLVRTGAFTIDSMEEMKERIDAIAEVAEVVGLRAYSQEFVKAYLGALRVERFNHGTFVNMLRKHRSGSKKYLVYPTVVENLREIEDVLNYERSLANRVRVF